MFIDTLLILHVEIHGDWVYRFTYECQTPQLSPRTPDRDVHKYTVDMLLSLFLRERDVLITPPSQNPANCFQCSRRSTVFKHVFPCVIPSTRFSARYVLH